MKKTLLLVFGALLMAQSAFCGKALLRLERAAAPDGDWVEVPAGTVPVTEGDFEDSFESDTAFYRMRIDVIDDKRPPGSIPLRETPALARNLAQQHLDDNSDIGGDNGWEGAVLGPVAFPMYNPAVGGTAYIEFKVIEGPEDAPVGALATTRPREDRGFILVSLTRNDFPIVAYATEGLTRTELLREQAKSSGVRIFRYDSVYMVAENAAGEVVAHLGSEPVRYPDGICDYIGQEFEYIVDEQGEKLPEGAPDLTGEPYESYQAFKQDYMQSARLQQARQARRGEAQTRWDILEGLDPQAINVTLGTQTTALQDRKVKSFVLGDPTLASIEILDLGLSITGNSVGGTVLHVVFDAGGQGGYALIVSEEVALSHEQPSGWSSWTTYYAGSWSDQRRYYQDWCSSCGCYTGCGPVAWAMLYGWFDYKGYANLIDGTAPLYNNSDVEDCILAVRNYMGTYCVGSSAATNPWDMPDGKNWARYDRSGVSYSISTTYSIPCFPTSGCRSKARDSIKNEDRPAIIGLWCTSAHYCVAYGYRYRKYTWLGVTLSTERQFKCNLGSGGSSPSWEDASVWYGNKPDFW